jgi:GNAT superfamily N-acetyltransferase
MDIQIYPLDEITLHDATVLRDSVFQDLSDDEYETLALSLNPSGPIYSRLGICQLHYWVAIDTVSKKVVGLVGLYLENSDNEGEFWLGWYCVDPNYRGYKIGSKLLKFAIDLSKVVGMKSLHLYTTADEEYTTARIQYEKMGFKQYKSQSSQLYYKLCL